jgi:hypothetical protein
MEITAQQANENFILKKEELLKEEKAKHELRVSEILKRIELCSLYSPSTIENNVDYYTLRRLGQLGYKLIRRFGGNYWIVWDIDGHTLMYDDLEKSKVGALDLKEKTATIPSKGQKPQKLTCFFRSKEKYPEDAIGVLFVSEDRFVTIDTVDIDMYNNITQWIADGTSVYTEMLILKSHPDLKIIFD